ncbi:MAG: hypothetical protein SGPRY_004494, partial [Prymnesium sp.]
VVDRLGGGSFGREQLLLMQRFATQCGISLRNAGVPSAIVASAEACTSAQRQVE